MFLLWLHFGSLLLALGFAVPTSLPTVQSYSATILSDHPLAYWRLHNLCGDQIARDETANHLDGTIEKFGVCTTQCTLPIGEAALAFDGCQGAIDLGNPPVLDLKSGNISIEAWVKIELPIKAAENIVSHGCPNNGNAGEVSLRIVDGDYSGGVWDGRPHFARCTVPAEDNGKWVHLVLVYDGADWILYRNGREFARTTDAVGLLPIPTGWKIGAGATAGDANYFKGAICDVAIYNVALTPERIKSHYCAGKGTVKTAATRPTELARP